jgi:hypothetical protein
MTDGRMALEVWGLDIPGKNLTLQCDLYSQVTGADDVAVTHVRRDFAATATSANGSVTLTGWNIDAKGKPTETAPINLGAGSSPRAVTIGTNLFVVAMIMPGGMPRLSTFSISPSSPAQIFTLSEVDAPFTATEIDVAGGPALAWGGETQILLAGRKNAGGVRLHLYTVSGLIAQFTEQAHLDVADLTGVSLGRTSFYSTAYKLAGVGPAPDYEANLIFLDTAGDQIANVGSASYQRDTSTATRVAGLGFSANSATLFTLNSSGGVRVTAHDIDTRDGGALPILYNLLSDSGLPADHGTALDAAQVYDSGAAGAYLVATVGSDQLVHLVAWRLGWQ